MTKIFDKDGFLYQAGQIIMTDGPTAQAEVDYAGDT